MKKDELAVGIAESGRLPRPGYCWVITTQANDKKYVSRAGVKLEHALREFGVDVTGLVCADFDCNVGGFRDCPLQQGAAKVLAIDTGYGELDYPLPTDDRGVVMERMNVLHVLGAEDHPPSKRVGVEGTLAEERPEKVRQLGLAHLPRLGLKMLASTTSPMRGAKSGRKTRGQGNVEYLVWACKIITP